MIVRDRRYWHIAFIPFVFLLLPLVQSSFQFVEIEPLKGAFVEETSPTINKVNWLNGTYQDSTETYLKSKLGFYDLLIRFNNQVNYSLFKEINTDNVIRVKEGHFMDIRYVQEYSGESRHFDPLIDRKLWQFKLLQDTLLQEGINLLLVLEPSKSRIYDDLIPEKYLYHQKQGSNYNNILKNLNELEVCYLDLNNYFKIVKDTTKWRLFPEPSVHWSTYGMTVALDTLIGFTNYFTNYRIDRFTINNIEIDKNIRFYTEYDIGDAMNLIDSLPFTPLAYPQTGFNNNSKTDKPSALFIGDSFVFNILNYNSIDSLFSKYEFWYYMTTRFKGHGIKMPLVLKPDLKAELKKFELVYLMQAELTYNDFGWGFIEQLYDVYFPNDKETRYEYFTRSILKNRNWIEKLKTEAGKKNISVKKAIINDAIYMLSKEFEKSKSEFIDDYYILFEHYIKSDSVWFASVKQKAGEKKNQYR